MCLHIVFFDIFPDIALRMKHRLKEYVKHFILLLDTTFKWASNIQT